MRVLRHTNRSLHYTPVHASYSERGSRETMSSPLSKWTKLAEVYYLPLIPRDSGVNPLSLYSKRGHRHLEG